MHYGKKAPYLETNLSGLLNGSLRFCYLWSKKQNRWKLSNTKLLLQLRRWLMYDPNDAHICHC